MPETGEGPLVPGDFGALQALDSKTRPHDFDYLSSAFRFRTEKGKSQYAIAFDVPIAKLTATPESNKHRYHAYVLALVKNEQGEIVDRISKDVFSDVADTSLIKLRSESMIYERAVNLAPGHYTVESAVVDQEGNRASTNTFQLDSREPTPGPQISDITLLRRIRPLDRAPDPSDPFEIPGKRAQPFVSTTLAANALPVIYFVVYPEEPNATIEAQFLKNGKVIATQKSAVPQPDPSGAVPMTLQPTAFAGDYEVKITVQQGQRSAQRNLKYTIAAK